MKTFRRNVFKAAPQQTGHGAERSCSLRPRKAVAFLTHLPRAPEAWRREFRRLRTATQRATRPLRESILHLGVCRLRRQIFREMKGKAEEILCGFPSIFLKYLGKDASKMRANRCKAGAKTSPAALSWSSLFGATVLKLFCCCTMPFVTVLAIL